MKKFYFRINDVGHNLTIHPFLPFFPARFSDAVHEWHAELIFSRNL